MENGTPTLIKQGTVILSCKPHQTRQWGPVYRYIPGPRSQTPPPRGEPLEVDYLDQLSSVQKWW